MLVILWALKKSEYELKGRRLRLKTNHKAPLEIRNNNLYNNYIINRYIEARQELDFESVYIEGKNGNGGLFE